MAGVWPNLDLSDLVTRARTYLNEGTAKFYTDAEIYRRLSIAAKIVAQEGSCPRRILDAVTVNGTRTVTTSGYKVHHVEYIPSAGRTQILTEIDPLKVGHNPLKGTTPQYWYEFGGSIGIEPLPDAAYALRLYVADIPKMLIATVSTFASGWTAGTGWAATTSAAHTGATSGDLTYDTTLAASTAYTFMFTVSGVSSGTLTPYAGTTAGVAITTNGYHTQNITTSAGSPALKFTATGGVTIDDLYVYKEADFAAVSDQTELEPLWQHILVTLAAGECLIRDSRPGNLLMATSIGEIEALRSNFVETFPEGREDRRVN